MVRRMACMAALAAATVGLSAWAVAAAGTPSAEPTAHDPHYESSAWKGVAEKGAFRRETWPAARLLVWARPGEDGNLDQAENWLEDGKPAQAAPDAETDILLPSAGKEYRVGGSSKSVRMEVRHVTVGANAFLTPYRYSVRGNAWVQAGGSIGSGHAAGVAGERHTFFRNDNGPMWESEGRLARLARIGQYMGIMKSKGASCEFIGQMWTTDELGVKEGTCVLSEGSGLLGGPNSSQMVGPGATLVLLSGSRFGKQQNKISGNVDIVIQGEMLVGTPERPITDDVILGVSYKDLREDPLLHGFKVMPTGKVRIVSADPTKARLVLKWHGLVQARPRNEPDKYDALPRTISVLLQGDVELDGVLFDDVRKGGIVLEDLAVRSRWKHVFFGPNNAAAPDELFSRYEPPPKPRAAWM